MNKDLKEGWEEKFDNTMFPMDMAQFLLQDDSTEMEYMIENRPKLKVFIKNVYSQGVQVGVRTTLDAVEKTLGNYTITGPIGGSICLNKVQFITLLEHELSLLSNLSKEDETFNN